MYISVLHTKQLTSLTRTTARAFIEHLVYASISTAARVQWHHPIPVYGALVQVLAKASMLFLSLSEFVNTQHGFVNIGHQNQWIWDNYVSAVTSSDLI